MLQAIGTGCGCPDDRFRKTSLCSALVITLTRDKQQRRQQAASESEPRIIMAGAGASLELPDP